MLRVLFSSIYFALCFLLVEEGYAKERVDVALVFCVDNSGSVNDSEFQILRAGHAAAIRDASVLDSIMGGMYGKIAVTYVEWSGGNHQQQMVEWSVVSDAASAESFASRLETADRSLSNSNTSIIGALMYCTKLLENSGYSANAWVIDIAGDGTQNDSYVLSETLPEVRAGAIDLGIEINGLVILGNPNKDDTHENPPEGLEQYYIENVKGGITSFVEVAEGFDNFAEAIRKKMSIEIAMLR